jgi:hypothetical protein
VKVIPIEVGGGGIIPAAAAAAAAAGGGGGGKQRLVHARKDFKVHDELAS